MKYLLLPILFFYSCVGLVKKGSSASFQRDGNTITVIGEAPIYQGDIQNAKQRAIKDAKIDAVRKLIGEEISNKSQSQDGESLGSSLLSKTNAFVKSYEIVDEAQKTIDTQPILVLTVRCEVEETKISLAVDRLLEDIGNPRVAVLSFLDSKVDATSQAELMKKLKENGNKVVFRNFSNFLTIGDFLNNAGVNSNSDILKNLQNSADVLLLANLTSQEQPKITEIAGRKLDIPMFSTAAYGNYQVILLWGDSKIVASGNYDSREVDINKKMSKENAVVSWSSGVSKEIAKKLKDEWFKLSENNEIIIEVNNLSPDDIVTFKDDLLEFTGIKKIDVRKQTKNKSELVVIYPGKDQMLKDELFYKKDSGFGFLRSGKKMNIGSASRGLLTLDIR